MILDNVPGKPLRWTRATKWALTPAVVLICLSLTGCSGHSPTLQPNPLISTPNEEVGLGSTLVQEQHPCGDSLEVNAYLHGQITLLRENGNEKEAARHFIKAIEIADEITDRNPCDEAYKAQYGLAELLRKMSPSDPDEEIREINDRVDSYLAKKAGEIGEFPFPNPSDHEKRQYGLITLAAEGDLPEAQLSLGALFLSNTPFMEKILPTLNPKDLCKDRPGRTPNSDPDGYAKKAFDWFQRASTPRANNALGMMYLYDLVSDDQSDDFLRCQKALYFFRQATQDYVFPAVLENLGTMYEHGHGLREGNFREAMRYYHLGAQSGSPRSQIFLARHYLSIAKDVEDFKERLGKYGKAPELRSAWERSLIWLNAFDQTCDRLSKEVGKTEAECARGPESEYDSMVKDFAAALCSSPTLDPENCNMEQEEYVRNLVKSMRGWQKKGGYKTGTGFVVYSETWRDEFNTIEVPSTYILTNAHVVTPGSRNEEPHWETVKKPTCSETEIFFENSPIPVFVQPEIISRSPHYDLALLKLRMDAEERRSVIFRSEEESLDLGEKSYAFGYPYADELSFEMHATEGNVAATAGEFSDPGTFETEAALRSGNSGGPILDSKGQVIGVAVSGWFTRQKERVKGVVVPTREPLLLELPLPKGEHVVNFAISHKAVHDFFDQLKNEGKIDFTLEPDREAPSLEPEAIAEKARDFTVHIQCWTAAPSSALTLSE